MTVQSLLEPAGIECEVRHEAVALVLPGVPFLPEIWVRDEDHEEARAIVRQAQV
jgi:hypothetical protein